MLMMRENYNILIIEIFSDMYKCQIQTMLLTKQISKHTYDISVITI